SRSQIVGRAYRISSKLGRREASREDPIHMTGIDAIILQAAIWRGDSAYEITGSRLAVPVSLSLREEPEPQDPEGLLDRPAPVPGVPGRALGDHRPAGRGQDGPARLHQDPLRSVQRDEHQAQ